MIRLIYRIVNSSDKKRISIALHCIANRSGKSSIERVIFHKMPPHETLFLESTHEVNIHYIGTVLMLLHSPSPPSFFPLLFSLLMH